MMERLSWFAVWVMVGGTVGAVMLAVFVEAAHVCH